MLITSLPTRYAFVTYKTTSGATEALKKLDNFPIMGMPMRVGRAKIPHRNQGGLGGVPWMDFDAAPTYRYVVRSGASPAMKPPAQLPIGV